MRAWTAVLVLFCAFSSAFCGERRGLDVGVQAPPLLGGTWICDGKAPTLNGTVRVVQFWFAG